MKTKEKLQKQIEDLQKQIKELGNSDFQTIKHKGNEFRIYKWENKKFTNFKIPKGYSWAKYFDVVELVNEDKLEFTKPWAEVYVCKNQFKRNKKYFLSRWYLDGGSCLNSGYDYLGNSYDLGRVVLIKKLAGDK